MMPSLFFPPACPNCGQQRNRCICLPFLKMARVANNPKTLLLYKYQCSTIAS
jgi:hypothetical protein